MMEALTMASSLNWLQKIRSAPDNKKVRWAVAGAAVVLAAIIAVWLAGFSFWGMALPTERTAGAFFARAWATLSGKR